VFPTYGDIISTIKQEGLKMCIEHRIIKQLNDNKRKAKYETGNLCEQYEILPIESNKYHKRSFHKNKSFQPATITTKVNFFFFFYKILEKIIKIKNLINSIKEK
jgi:hypothetical protein